jgi:CheY-like chemotaxis protein
MNGHRGHGPKADLVLVADDDFTIRLLCREALEGAGYTVAEADSGEEALERFGKLGPDLVLLDVMMAGMDGFGTLEAIRRDPERGNVPVVMITGLEDASADQLGEPPPSGPLHIAGQPDGRRSPSESRDTGERAAHRETGKLGLGRLA